MRHEVDRNSIPEFLLAGNCECIIRNDDSNNQFEYRISQLKNDKKSESTGNKMYFVYVKMGKSYEYAGYLLLNTESGNVEYYKGKKGILTPESQPIKVLGYVFKNYKRMPKCVNVLHLGKCTKCGRSLTDVESIDRGMGPYCYRMIHNHLIDSGMRFHHN